MPRKRGVDKKTLVEDNELFLEKLTKENGAVQLRLEGIDALETHFTPMPLPTPPDLKSKEKEKDKEKIGSKTSRVQRLY